MINLLINCIFLSCKSYTKRNEFKLEPFLIRDETNKIIELTDKEILDTIFDIAELEMLIKSKKVRINKKYGNYSLIDYAIHNNNFEAIQFLIMQGCIINGTLDIKLSDCINNTSVNKYTQEICKSKNTKDIRKFQKDLIKKLLNCNTPNEVIDILQAGCNINDIDNKSLELLYEKIQNFFNLNCFLIFLDRYEGNLNLKVNGRTIISYVTEYIYEYNEIAYLLLDKGVDTNLDDNVYFSPLFQLVSTYLRHRNITLVKNIVDRTYSIRILENCIKEIKNMIRKHNTNELDHIQAYISNKLLSITNR